MDSKNFAQSKKNAPVLIYDEKNGKNIRKINKAK
jgi:hypothetical protein